MDSKLPVNRREFVAAAALQGLLASGNFSGGGGSSSTNSLGYVAERARLLADALLADLDKTA